ncbi:hypothetical protein L484_008465 [Morus notabilis]|uniref:F-box domain-containing protein n=1 Tax=Morus notabilis TaxID=981085 RepID=W9SER4_9ROSA|nr:uncharacterized protein LOC21391830 [Morus notabilis]EXC03133.1 hypothetical protein L484_008465 [Morus notabilis]
MVDWECIQKSLPDDIAVKIASSLQVSDLCALGSCSRFWRELCKSDCLWESLAKERWPFQALLEENPSSSSSSSIATEIPLFQGWRDFYIERHNEMASRVMEAVGFVEQSSRCESLEVGDYLKAIEVLDAMKLGFKDVEMLLFNPKLNSLPNLVGVQYCISWLGVPAEYVLQALQYRKISDRQVCIRWWKLGRWFYGFRMRDESHSHCVSLADLATAKAEEVLGVLYRGAVHEVLRVQISTADPSSASWYNQSTQIQG